MQNHPEERLKEKLDLLFFDIADVFWQWAFWLTLAVMTRLMWFFVESPEKGDNIPALLVLLLTNATTTITVKYITSCRKLRWKNDRDTIFMDCDRGIRSRRNRLRSSVPLAFKKALRRKSKNHK